MALQLLALDEDQDKRLRAFLRDGLTNAEASRGNLLEKVRIWRRNYLSEPEEKIKTSPWYKCSNVVTPMTPTHTDAIHARVKNTLTAYEDVWGVRPRTSEGDQFVDGLTRYLRYIQNEEMKFDDNGGQILLQTVKLGTCTAKCVYVTESRQDYTYDSNGKPVKRTLQVSDGFDLRAIDFEDLLVPSDARDPQTCRWIDHKHRLTYGQMKWREQNGAYIKGVLEKIKNYYSTHQNTLKEDKSRLQGVQTQVVTDARYAIHDVDEVWAFYDINDDGLDEHVVISYHPLSDTILRVVYNWLPESRRPFFRFRYWEQEDSYYGLGVCQMLEQTQKEIDMIHNQRNDNATIANMRCLKTRRGSGVTAGSRIYPGKVFILDNLDDLQDFMLGEIYPSSTNNEIIARDYGERRSAINDFNLGVEAKAIQRTPAATAMAVIQESNKRFDLVVRDIRNALRELGWWVIDVTAQQKPYGKIRRVLGADVSRVLMPLFELPTIAIRQRVHVDIVATSSSLNKETETQKLLQIFGLTMNYFKELAPVAQALTTQQAPPQLVQLAVQMADVLSELVKRTYRLNDLIALADKVPGLMETLGGGTQNPVATPGTADQGAQGAGLDRLSGLRQEIGLLPEQPAPGQLRRVQ